MKPRFSPSAGVVLDTLDSDSRNDDFVDRIWDTIDLVCAEPQPSTARRRALRTDKGHSVWMVPVPGRYLGDAWVILWQARGDEALIAYIGPDDFRSSL